MMLMRRILAFFFLLKKKRYYRWLPNTIFWFLPLAVVFWVSFCLNQCRLNPGLLGVSEVQNTYNILKSTSVKQKITTKLVLISFSQTTNLYLYPIANQLWTVTIGFIFLPVIHNDWCLCPQCCSKLYQYHLIPLALHGGYLA